MKIARIRPEIDPELYEQGARWIGVHSFKVTVQPKLRIVLRQIPWLLSKKILIYESQSKFLRRMNSVQRP